MPLSLRMHSSIVLCTIFIFRSPAAAGNWLPRTTGLPAATSAVLAGPSSGQSAAWLFLLLMIPAGIWLRCRSTQPPEDVSAVVLTERRVPIITVEIEDGAENGSPLRH